MVDKTNPLIDAYNFFFANIDRTRVDVHGYLRKRCEVLNNLREGILGNPGYLGLFCGFVLGWAGIIGYLSFVMAEFYGMELSSESVSTSMDAYLARMLAGAFVLLIVGLVSRWYIDSYERRRKLIADDCSGAERPGWRLFLHSSWKVSNWKSRVWMVFSLILCLVFGLAAGAYLFIVVGDEASMDVSQRWTILLVVLIGAWARCIRACSLSVGLVNRFRLFALPFLMAFVLGLLGFLLGSKLSMIASSCEPVHWVLEFGVPLSTMANLVWFGLVGVHLMMREHELMRAQGKSKFLNEPQIMPISEWARRDIPMLLISGALATFALIMLELMGLVLTAGL